MAAQTPVNGTAHTFYIMLQSMANPGSFQIDPTLAAGDFQISKDGGAFANLATLPDAEPNGTAAVRVQLSSGEMTADNVVIRGVDQTSPKEWADFACNIQPQAAGPLTAAAVVNEWETQSQADPTGFHVNVKEIDGTAQTANDNGADINTIVTNIGTPSDLNGGGATLAGNAVDLLAAIASSTTTMDELYEAFTLSAGAVGATGNDTTHIHLDGLTFADDELNDLLLIINDDSSSLKHSRWITDWVNATELATLHEALPASPTDQDTYHLFSIRRDVSAGGGGDATEAKQDTIIALIGTPAADLAADIGTRASQASVDDLPTNAEFASGLAAVDDDVLTAIGALENLSAADVNAEMDTALADAELTGQMTEGYSALGVEPTLTQAIFQILAMLQEKGISGATLTLNGVDGTTPVMTFTLDDADNPTAITRAT